MERIFLNTKLPSVTVIPVENGAGWTTTNLRNQIISKFCARKSFPEKVIIWFDREKNCDCSITIGEYIKHGFFEVGYPKERVHYIIPDMMSENIILSDEVLMREILGDNSYTYPGDGCNGKSRLKILLESIGEDYKETTVGVKLLGKVRLARCTKENVAVHNFLSEFDLPCYLI